MNKIELCKTIQLNVSKLTDSENLELFKIILDTNANYTKNNNGIFLNLNWIDEELLVKINNYITFCIKSQNEISKYELMKTLLNDSINTRDTTDYEDTQSCNIGDTIKDALGTSGSTGVTECTVGNASNAGNASTEANASNGANASTGANASNGANATTGAETSSQTASNVNIMIPKQKFSSSMKFYLLKKKFMKQNTTYNTCIDNDLTYEDYLIT